jgi:hypothetical protein
VRVRSDRAYWLPISRQALWQRITIVDAYQNWWPWLRELHATTLAAGETWRCRLQPPMPYTIRCDIRFQTVVDDSLIVALVTGDLTGHARIELQDERRGTEVRVLSELAARSWPIRIVARVLPTLARRAHDWVLDSGADRFGAANVEATYP